MTMRWFDDLERPDDTEKEPWSAYVPTIEPPSATKRVAALLGCFADFLPDIGAEFLDTTPELDDPWAL